MTQQPPREEHIFLAALEKSTPQERRAFLDEACQGDEALRCRLLELLASHEASYGPLDVPPLGGTAVDATECTGTQIGPYKLIQIIGEGGMGVVYMAEQKEPVNRQVALKIIKPGMDSRQVVARFEVERQALSLMDHPNIAKVLDAGTTDSGRPYFVMELVKGQPITQYCDERDLTPRQRLELFLPVCQAIQHAHQKGIIHRDLKPTNILVADFDQQPVPKVIDFGVAKAIGQPVTGTTMTTSLGQIIGTLEYMSPEQARLDQRDIDTRTDIYSLGVLLYELLTGQTPFDRQQLRSAAFDEVLRVIREVEPPKPSQRLSEPGSLESKSNERRLNRARRTKLVCGELDWIVMKCLEKDRKRRYATVNALARDLERYLRDEPVEACPPSAWYRFQKFARRHQAALLVATSLFVALLAVAATLWRENRWSRRALEQEKRANTELAKAFGEQRHTLNSLRVALAHRDYLANRPQDARKHLGECDPELRDRDWHYVQRLCRMELYSFPGTGAAPSADSLTFGPDSRHLAAAYRDGSLKVWNTATGREALALPPGTVPAARSVSFTDDGARLIVVAFALVENEKLVDPRQTHVTLWELSSGRKTESFRWTRQPKVLYDIVSPNGQKLLAIDIDKRGAKICDAMTGDELFVLDKAMPNGSGSWGVFSPCGKSVALWATLNPLKPSSHRVEVSVFDTATGKLQLTANLDEEFPDKTVVALSPDGSRLAGMLGSAVRSWEPFPRIFDLQAGKVLHTLHGHSGGINRIVFSLDGRYLATASKDNSVIIWDARTGQKVFDCRGHTSQVRSVRFSPDGNRLASRAVDDTVKVWDISPWETTLADSGTSK